MPEGGNKKACLIWEVFQTRTCARCSSKRAPVCVTQERDCLHCILPVPGESHLKCLPLGWAANHPVYNLTPTLTSINSILIFPPGTLQYCRPLFFFFFFFFFHPLTSSCNFAAHNSTSFLTTRALIFPYNARLLFCLFVLGCFVFLKP